MLRIARIAADGVPNTPQEISVLIRDHLLSLPVDGGERIFEAQIARQVGVSRPLVREACRILEAEKLLTYTPNKGYSLRVLKKAEVEKLIEFRLILEIAAAQAAAVSPERAEIVAALRAAYRRIEELSGTEDPAQQISADLAFHRVLIESMNNEWVTQSFDRLSTQMRYAIRMMSRSLHDFKIYAPAHAELISCLEKGDPMEIKQKISHHIRMFLPTLLKRVKE